MIAIPPIKLHDFGFRSEISQINVNTQNQHDQANISLFPGKDMLVIQGKAVFWYKGDLISRKFIYDTPVVNAFFTTFSSAKSESSRKEQTLVIVLKETAYMYYEDGRSYISSFPFQINNALPYENGVVLERSNSQSNPFLTITEPMNELGSIVSSSTSSISNNENLLHLPKTQNTSIAVTFNEEENIIKLYHTRFLNRSTINPMQSSISLRPKTSLRKTSLAPNGSTTTISENDTEIKGDDIKIEKKRAVSHNQVLSIDRMASYDLNGNLKLSEPVTSSTLSKPSFRKDAILTRIDLLKLNYQNRAKNIKISAIYFDGKEAIILKNEITNLFEVLVFESHSSYKVSIPNYLHKIKLSDQYLDYAVCKIPGFIVLLSKANKFVLFNPFLKIESVSFEPTATITKIHDSSDSQLIVEDASKQIRNYQLKIEPTLQIVQKILTSFKFLVNSYTYNYILLAWINAFAIKKKEWDALVLTILVIVLPFSVEKADVDSSNEVSILLKDVFLLQMKALEDEFTLHEMAPNFIVALHIIREELKMNILQASTVGQLGVLLAQLTYWSGWNEQWYSFYEVESSKLNKNLKLNHLQLLESPPDLMKSLVSLFDHTIVSYCTFSRLVQESHEVDELVTPRTSYVLRLFEAIISTDFEPSDVVNLMIQFNITPTELETYPVGVVVPLRESISYCQRNLTSLNQGIDRFDLIERRDLQKLSISDPTIKYSSKLRHHSQQQTKDIHQIITSIQEQSEPSVPIETDRFNVTKLIFSEDRRFYEISKILQTFQTQALFADELDTLPEQIALVKQKELAALVALRTLTIPLGRSMLFYSSKIPLVTEKFPVPKINLNTLIQPDNVTVSLDKGSLNQYLLQWGYFHNGASSGLTIARDAKGISGSWIVFNKPESLNEQHGGFLLGLGLNGHLKDLEEWNIYNYLGPKHPFTSVGLLLGMSASLRGTMDVKLTKVLSVHVVALLPYGASDLIISTQVQTAGLVGIGLLYLESQHRRMSEILLSQINGNVIVEEKQEADESYRLAAGIGLGYVNLGKGNDLRGLSDTRAVDKLLAIAAFMKDVQTEEGYDKSMAGAIVALSFIYLKTNNHSVSKKLEIPDSHQLLDYIRPDLLLLRSLAKNLILWDDIGYSEDWVESQLPTSLLETKENDEVRCSNLNYYYIISGLCISIGIKYASTSNINARNTIITYYDKITELLGKIENNDNYSMRLIRQALSTSQLVMAISMSLVMAATGDLEIFRRLRILHGKLNTSNSTGVYGKMMAANMSLGLLFLAGGQYSLNTTSNFGVAALVTSIYPLFPKHDTSDPDIHLQALRHFWSLTVEPRCLIVRDVETSKPIKSDVKIQMKNNEIVQLTSPCLLPPLESISKIQTDSPQHFNLVIDDISHISGNADVFVYKKHKVGVLKQSVKSILSEVNKGFDNDQFSEEQNKLIGLDILQGFKKSDIISLLSGSPNHGYHPSIIDRQIELEHMASSPNSMYDLWNLRLIFAYYDKHVLESKAYYLTIEYIESLKSSLWALSRSLS